MDRLYRSERVHTATSSSEVTRQAAMDIMEKQGGASADRPRWVAGGELLSGGFRILPTPVGERLRRMRRALHTHMQPKAAQAYESLQMLHATRTVLGLLESPEQYQDHARAYAASVILELTYGKNTPTHASHPDVLHVRKSLHRFGMSLRPGAYLVDSLPWLKYLPWYGRELRRAFIEDYTLYHRQLDTVKRQMVRSLHARPVVEDDTSTRCSQNDPESGPSFAKFLLAREIDFGLDDTEMAFLAGSMFTAGSDTTALAICNAMTAAARHPDAQAAVHAELDAVVGNGRPPTFDDEESLPILRAFILESMRWRPLAPLGVAHRATEDIIWGDYCIPAGTTMFGHHWAISRDPEVFPDPDMFNITRWLTPDGNLRDDLKFPYFGFGRRVCPGQHVATRQVLLSLFINTAFTLWSFHLSVDESKPADDLAFLNGAMKAVEPIGLHFEPRMAKETLKTMMEQ
ncbi:cytochrome P450 [Lanmaoa asiatica]|nr:cytochrome P450 [Lanmaoa asiatica]